MGSLVQQHSTTGQALDSSVETFSACVAGNLMILVAATNENAGVNNINAPTGGGWTLLHTYRQGTIDVNQAVYGKIAAGGETTVTITSSAAAQRLQTWFGEFSGYTLNVEDTSTAGISSSVLAGDTGTATAPAGGRLWLGMVTVKNSPASGLTGSGSGTAATVNNESVGSPTSGNKILVGVWYDLNASGAERQQPTWTTTSARYGGLGLILAPPVTSRPRVLLPRRSWAGR